MQGRQGTARQEKNQGLVHWRSTPLRRREPPALPEQLDVQSIWQFHWSHARKSYSYAWKHVNQVSSSGSHETRRLRLTFPEELRGTVPRMSKREMNCGTTSIPIELRREAGVAHSQRKQQNNPDPQGMIRIEPNESARGRDQGRKQNQHPKPQETVSTNTATVQLKPMAM